MEIEAIYTNNLKNKKSEIKPTLSKTDFSGCLCIGLSQSPGAGQSQLVSHVRYTHRPYQKGETVAAVATAPGEGGIAVVRISGNEALLVAAKVYSGPIQTYHTHTVRYGRIVDENGQTVDEVLAVVMRAPRSYTGEDTVEIHCHGGSLITRRVLETILRAGARAALPGEFTFKAYMNGKLDLAQAEAVQELISAKNEMALKAAENQLHGALSKKIELFQKELIDIAAIIEAWVDFPEEGLEFATLDEIVERLQKTQSKMQLLSDSFHEGKILHDGLTLCLAGSPNVGKSSLMNTLLGQDRAIVTDIPGTTRDLLEAEMRLSGLHFKLLDTAGIRATDEMVEKEGIRRSKEAMKTADLILLVLDAHRGISSDDSDLIASAPEHKTILVWNKIDLPTVHIKPEKAIKVSARSGEGIENLRHEIDRVIWSKGPPSKEEVTITNVRHKQAVDQAIASLEILIHSLKNGVSPEFLSSDMRKALSELGTIIGSDIAEDILSAIFSKFCVGK